MRMRIPHGRIAILAAPLLCFAALVGTTQSADAAKTAYEIASDHTSTCLVDNSGSVYLQSGCPADAGDANHAALWYEVNEGLDLANGQTMYELENVHVSGSCLTMNDSGGVYMATCSTNHVEFWEFIADPGGGYQAVQNVHTRLALANASGDEVWHFIPASV
jgi:hypothetical protein